MYFNGTKCYSLMLCCFLSLSLSARDVKKEVETQGLRKPLCFLENKGQLTDQNNHPRNDIQYTLSTPGMSLFIGCGQMHYQFKKVDGSSANARMETYRMDMTLKGANLHAGVAAENKQAYYENYLLPNCGDGITAHSWTKITYRDIYPNIDWVIYVKNNEVEYDFNVRPGGNVKDIQLEFGGATSLAIAKNGGIIATTPMGNITEKKPYAYSEDGKEVASAFKLHGNTVTFETGNYNGTLVIDPYLLWSTYLGGANADVATSVAYDASHNTYVGGYSASTTIATGGAYHSTYQGGTYDAFVAKYNNAGTLQFVTYYGGTGSDQCMAVQADASGVYLAGVTNSNINIASFGAYHGALNGGTDGFVAKLNTSGNFRIWGTYYGGTSNDAVNAIALDGSGNIYITGQTASSTLIASAGAYQTTRNGTNDAFVAKFSTTTGANTWSTYYGGSAQDNGLGITCSPSGNVFITGQTNSVTNMASAGAYQTSLAGAHDAFIAMFTSAGTRSWGTYFGGTLEEQANGIAYDNISGNIAIIGNTTSSSGIATANGFQPTFSGIQDAFVGYFSAAGSRIWSSYYGGTQLDYGQGICFDAFGNVLVCGGTFSATGMAGINSLQPTIGGDYDAFIAKINSLGQTIWNTYFGGTFYDYANAVTCDANNQIVIAGYTSSLGNYGSGGVSTVGSAQAANNGGTYDAFIARFKTDTTVIVNQPYTDTLLCAGGTFNVSYSVYIPGATFQPGNTFTAQLSNASGSFSSPVNIGSVTATGSGTIPVTIPAGTATGSGYRIRIVSSNPAFISPDDYKNISVVASITDASAYSNSPVCVGGDIKLFDNPTYSVASYSWSGPLGFSSALQNPVISSVTLANAGTYTVTTVHNGCPPVTDAVTVAVNNVFPPNPTTGPADALCAGGTLSLTANPGAVTGVTYHWIGPTGFTSTLQNPTITGATTANSGIYYVQDSLNGCPSSLVPDTITVMPVVPVSLTITADAPYITGAPGDTICGGTMVHFVAHPVNEGPSPTFQWMTSLTSPVIGATASTWASSTLNNGDVVYCKLMSNITCPSPAVAVSNGITMNVITNSPRVYIAAVPGIHVAPHSPITFYSTVYNGGIGALYQWTRNGVPIPGATSDTFTIPSVTKADTIALVVTSTMACATPDQGVSNTLIVNTNVGVANISAAFDNLQLFPNPNNGSFIIKGSLENINGNLNVDVTNLLGQVIYSGNATIQNNEVDKSVELQNIAPGIYFLRVSQENTGKVFRFSVQH